MKNCAGLNEYTVARNMASKIKSSLTKLKAPEPIPHNEGSLCKLIYKRYKIILPVDKLLNYVTFECVTITYSLFLFSLLHLLVI